MKLWYIIPLRSHIGSIKIITEYYFSAQVLLEVFKVNKLTESTVLFAIGNTTAATIKNYSAHKIIIAEESSKENLFEKVIEYFT